MSDEKSKVEAALRRDVARREAKDPLEVGSALARLREIATVRDGPYEYEECYECGAPKASPIHPAYLESNEAALLLVLLEDYVSKKLIEGQCIQWHLPTTKHDRCPQCEQPSIVQGRGSERYCTNESCASQFRTWRLPIPVSEWLQDPDQVAYITTKKQGERE